MSLRLVARLLSFPSLAALVSMLGCPAPADEDGTTETEGQGTTADTTTVAGSTGTSPESTGQPDPSTGSTSSSTTTGGSDSSSSSGGLDTSSGSTGSTGSTGDTDQTSSTDSTSTGEPVDEPPPVPAGLVVYVTGDPDDADVEPSGPGLVLMGGGSDVDEAFMWWGDYIEGGDVVVIRTSGADGYNDYLYDFGNADSVETMIVTAGFADDPYVSWTIAHAEAVWLAGGDQATYLQAWMGTGVEQSIQDAWDRGAVVGGTSAGLAVLGQFMFAAYNDTVYSYEALEDPYNFYMTMEQGFLALPMLAGIITDSHFVDRDRMGRLIGFLARIHADGWATTATGLGIDEATAVVVGPDGMGTVIGAGHAYVVLADDAPQTCMAGVPLEYDELEVHALSPGDAIAFPGALTMVPGDPIAASGGVTIPANPYL